MASSRSGQSNPWALDTDDTVETQAPTVSSAPPVAEEVGLSRVPLQAPTKREPAHEPAQTPVATDPRMTPSQRVVFDELLAIGASRPTSPPDLPQMLSQRLIDVTSEALISWPERSLWVGKAGLFSVARCEGGYLAERDTPKSGLTRAVAVGQVAHRAIQVSHTHPDRPAEVYVRAAVAACREEETFEAFWSASDMAQQSDVLVAAASRTVSFLDSWPRLLPEWSPRFEEPLQARVGKLTLSGRPDLVLGRPRPDGKQSMFLTDFKSGSLKEDHDMEGLFYALVATLRHGVAPFRSCVYSLSSGEWTEPDITTERLLACASWVGEQVVKMVEVLTEQRSANLIVSSGCSFCPAKGTCSEFIRSVEEMELPVVAGF